MISEQKRRGRPPGESAAWGGYIEQAEFKGNEAMALLGRLAWNRGYSMASFADARGVTLRAFQRYFGAPENRLQTIVEVCRALGRDELTARALMRQLTDRDLATLERRVMEAFPGASLAVLRSGGRGLAAVPGDVRKEALRAAALADADLDPNERPPKQAFAETLGQAGFPFYQDLICGAITHRISAFTNEVNEFVAVAQQLMGINDNQGFQLADLLTAFLTDREPAGERVPRHVFESRVEIEEFKKSVLDASHTSNVGTMESEARRPAPLKKRRAPRM
ncbi:MAG TPA: hypothetical protein VGX91_00910 [Candidatus Cybelea sp.]|jgi:hypothetical protein|nr:hypothetical protein [Candidatus Cybelea sp.]